MNSYEEKKQARIDRYNERAAEAAKQSGQLMKQSGDMLSAIPLGQPIHVGHYSEKADRRYRGRAAATFERGIRAADKSDYYADKAKAAENNNAISSDDPNALEKLRARVTALQALQDEMKRANAYYRKHKTTRGYPGISDEQADETDREVQGGYSFEQQPYPAYRLQNNNANIRRNMERIRALESKDLRAVNGWVFDGGRVEMNAGDNRIQIFFDGKPGTEVRDELKGRGFRWAPSVGAWQRQLNSNGLFAVRQLKCVNPNGGDGTKEADHA